MAKISFQIGDPVPKFSCRATNNELFKFDTIAGKYIVLTFFGTAQIDQHANILKYITTQLRHHFDDNKVSFFGVSIHPDDENNSKIKQILPGIRYFWDFNHAVSMLYGAIDNISSKNKTQIIYHPFTLILDPFLRVLANIPLNDCDRHNQILTHLLNKLPPIDYYASVPLHAPILILPRIFEPKFCHNMIDLYKKNGGIESGFMREKDGNTIGIIDNSFKQRKDFNFDDTEEYEDLRASIRSTLIRRLVPEIHKVFQFNVTRIERYIVACYHSKTGGFFRPHRDNTTKGTAHRRFACTINLNAEDYEGGDLRFPEFGMRTYRAPTGGAVVFSCSLLHEATPVTKGIRYAFLPFFYDEEAKKIREENRKFIIESTMIKNAS